MNGPRRLRLVGAQPRVEPALPDLVPIQVRAGAIAIGETVEGAGAVAFALALLEALHARGLSPWTTLCDFEGVPSPTAEERARLLASSPHSAMVRIAQQSDLVQLVQASERTADTAPLVFVGEPALLGLAGTLRLVIDREGVPASLTPRARRLRAAGHVVLSSARLGVARLLSEGWHSPTRAP